MKLEFTKHTLERLEERLITLKEIAEVLDNDFEIFGKDYCKIIRGKTKNNRYLDIIIDENERKILTVFTTKKKYRRNK